MNRQGRRYKNRFPSNNSATWSGSTILVTASAEETRSGITETLHTVNVLKHPLNKHIGQNLTISEREYTRYPDERVSSFDLEWEEI